MQRSAFIIALLSLFAFFSLALAVPLPVQVNKEAREATVELDAREGPVDYTVVHREAATDTGLEILVREHNTFENSVREISGITNNARVSQDLEPRICVKGACY